MSATDDNDTTDTTSDDTQPQDAGDGQGVGDGVDWKAEAAKWKRLSRQNEESAKANHEKLQRLQAAQDSTKTETQKLTERIEAAEKRAAEAESQALRAEVAQAKGLTAAQAKRLAGATKEELEADADELLEAFKPADGAKAGATDDKDGAGSARTGRPREKLRPGASNDEADDGRSPGDIAEAVLKSGF